jgi:hypothetical protein
MRCMVCGEEKVLAEAMPAEDMAVPGFEYQTLECPGCDDTERRLLFTGRVTGFARRATEQAHPHLDLIKQSKTSRSLPAAMRQILRRYPTVRASRSPLPKRAKKNRAQAKG